MNLKHLLTVGFAASIVTANVLAAKLVSVPLGVATVAVPGGFVAFGVAFLLSDLMVEYYGEGYAASVLWSTVAALGGAYALIWLTVAFPSVPFYDAGPFNAVLGASGGIIVASIVTISVSQRLDVWLFARIKRATGGRHRWARNILSTATSQAFDTVVFITLAFAVFPALQGGDPLLGAALASTIVGQYVAKVAVALADTPIFYAVTELID